MDTISLKFYNTNNSGNQKSSKSKLIEIIQDKDLRYAFYDFLSTQYCVENLLCWEAIEKFKNKNGSPYEMYIFAEEIYSLFISDNSRYEINIYGKQKDRLKETLKNTFILLDTPEPGLSTLSAPINSNTINSIGVTSTNPQSETFPKRKKKLRFRNLISKSSLSNIFADNSSGSNSDAPLNRTTSSINLQEKSLSESNLSSSISSSSDDSFVVIFGTSVAASATSSNKKSNRGSTGSDSSSSDGEFEEFDRKNIQFGFSKCCNLFNDIQEELEQMMIENSLGEFLKSKTFKV